MIIVAAVIMPNLHLLEEEALSTTGKTLICPASLGGNAAGQVFVQDGLVHCQPTRIESYRAFKAWGSSSSMSTTQRSIFFRAAVVFLSDSSRL